MKLPRNLKPAAVNDLNYRLKALPPALQMPRARCPRATGSRRCPARRSAKSRC